MGIPSEVDATCAVVTSGCCCRKATCLEVLAPSVIASIACPVALGQWIAAFSAGACKTSQVVRVA